MRNEEIIMIVVVSILVLFLFGGAGMMGFGGFGMGWMMYPFFSGGFFWPMVLFGMLIWILIVVILVLGIIWIVGQLQNSGGKR